MAKTTAYSMKNVTATLDGLQVQGLFDGDDAITVAPGADVGSLLVGADGCSIFSQTADRSASITLRLQHTSPTHRQLMQKAEQQRAGRLIGFPFSVLDITSNEGVVADQCFVSQAPSDSKGTNATVREWMLVTGDHKPAIPNG